MLSSKQMKKGIYYISVLLLLTLIISIIMIAILNDGKCHNDDDDDLSEYICKPTFHSTVIYVAITMIIFDAILFGIFCYKWWKLIYPLKLINDSTIFIDMVQSFSIKFIFTFIAMLSCFIDGIINLFYNDATSIIFCIDCAVIASCNFVMMQSLVYSYYVYSHLFEISVHTKNQYIHTQIHRYFFRDLICFCLFLIRFVTPLNTQNSDLCRSIFVDRVEVSYISISFFIFIILMNIISIIKQAILEYLSWSNNKGIKDLSNIHTDTKETLLKRITCFRFLS